MVLFVCNTCIQSETIQKGTKDHEDYCETLKLKLIRYRKTGHFIELDSKLLGNFLSNVRLRSTEETKSIWSATGVYRMSVIKLGNLRNFLRVLSSVRKYGFQIIVPFSKMDKNKSTFPPNLWGRFYSKLHNKSKKLLIFNSLSYLYESWALKSSRVLNQNSLHNLCTKNFWFQK